MTDLVNRLANLTAIRDRDALDIALVNAINELLLPLSTCICRVVGDAGNERWLISAKLQLGQTTPTSDSAWSPVELLPLVASHPLRQSAASTQQVQQGSGNPSVTVFPLAGTVDSIGVLEISTSEPMDADSLRLVTGVLRLYANFQSLLDYSERDGLTELLNRKTFDGAFLKATIEQKLSEEHAGADRRHADVPGSYWLVMIDIDHFKRVNDNFGHLIGDEVLLLLARLMRAHFRFHDQLYRFGGEEFVVLMRCHGEAEAAGVLERLRVTTQEHLFPQVGSITISIGFSEVKPGDTPSGAFERADKAVYFAKGHGRNQVCSHAALVASGELVEAAVNVGDMELF
jgi:diguanylate cyclase (GGDEF)-like protein